MALGSDIFWYECDTGDGQSYQLYFKSIGTQCTKTYMVASGVNGTSGPVSRSVTASPIIASGASATSTSSTTSAGTNSNKASPTKSTSYNVFASDAQIGMGLGFAVGASCLLLASFFYFRRRLRRRHRDSPLSFSQLKLAKPIIGEVSGKEKSHELAAGKGQLPELPVKESPQELPTERY